MPSATLNRPAIPTRTVAQLADVPEVVTLRQATTLSGLSAYHLHRRVATREQHLRDTGAAAPADPPAPLTRDGRLAGFLGLEFAAWCLRMGIWQQGVNGRRVIGYTGLAAMLGLEEQSLRRLHAEMPPPVVLMTGAGPKPTPLRDRGAAVRWAHQTGRLARDGRTPIRLRPRRTKARPPS